jgi:hypothetical protein
MEPRVNEVTAQAYGPAGGRVVWLISRDGEVISQVSCEDYPWARCVREAPKEGLILEFGVREGESLRQIATAASPRLVFGFDWWRGLPHSHGGFTKGDCAASRRPVVPANVVLVDGLFSSVLEGFLEAHRDDSIAFVNLDCDLFCSSFYVLHALVDRFVTGSVIALSDIAFSPDAQRLAWVRFLRESGQAWDYLGKNHPWGEVYRRS